MVGNVISSTILSIKISLYCSLITILKVCGVFNVNIIYKLCYFFSYTKKYCYGFNILGRKRRSYAFARHKGKWLYKIIKLTDA